MASDVWSRNLCRRIAVALEEGSCSAQEVLRDLLEVMVRADVHEERDAKADDVYEDIKAAEALLFYVATEHCERLHPGKKGRV